MAERFQTLQFRNPILAAIFVLFGACFPLKTQAWGPRAHALICEASIHLVKNQDLKRYLMSKIQGITYLCNTPDIYWKSLKGTESGYATHFFDPDLIGLSFDTIPVQYSDFEKLSKGKTNKLNGQAVHSPAREIGSSWWRAEQFFRLATEAGKRAAKSGAPTKDDEDLYQMWVMMGLLGHFVGDNAQPFHNTADYDGWQKNHGGIHGFYEAELVNELPHDIISDIIKYAPRAFKDLQLNKDLSVIESMRNLSILSYPEISAILSLDPIIKKSVLLKDKGMEIKTEAARKPAAQAIAKFKPVLVKHLARASTLLAHIWEKIFVESGKPPVGNDRSYRFPHQFEFIVPDYTENKL